MKKIRYGLITIVATMAFVGCSYVRKEPRVINVVQYKCGGTLVEATFRDDGTLGLDVDGRISRLTTVLAASGAKFETPSGIRPHITFWDKGTYAMLTVGKKAYPTCNVIEKTHEME
ncbi:MAG: hypothetical protein K0R63_426 [Rickettsiales bacterium]|jgi:membrane-bound inhibitor of C-type lysozyme|nr:hypothetical protein [Rickettsiales bacterium]